MNDSKIDSNDWAGNTTRNTARLATWTFAWVASMAVAAFGPKMLWDYAALPTVLSVIANLALGFGMILANGRYLKGLDEMHQRIFLDAGALTLGVGLVCGLSYELLSQTKLIPFEAEISHLVILMSLTFLAGLIAGHRRYG
jgi:hypothetical protein